MIVSCPIDVHPDSDTVKILRMLLELQNRYPQNKLEELVLQRGIV